MQITIEQLKYLIKDNLKDNNHKQPILEQFDLMVKENKYTLNDMKKACACGIDIACKEGENNFQPFEDLINSLNKNK